MTEDSVVRDPITNVIYGEHGIKRSVRILLDSGCYLGALTILFSTLDAMGNLDRPANNEKGTKRDFLTWADRYIRLEAAVRSDVVELVGTSRITSVELYAARCAVLHTYGSESDISRAGNARQIGWMVSSKTNVPCKPAAVCKPTAGKKLVMVDINHFSNVVLDAVDRFIRDALTDESRKEILGIRLRNLLCALPFLPNSS